jgi:hypothetical protein
MAEEKPEIKVEKKEPEAKLDTATGARIPLKWDDSGMETSYANVCNASSTQEEVTLLFGTNQTLLPGPDNEVKIKLTDRIILSPFAAKRLLVLLNNVVSQYETRFGTLNIDTRQAGGTK